jgi:hypothetical protein
MNIRQILFGSLGETKIERETERERERHTHTHTKIPNNKVE